MAAAMDMEVQNRRPRTKSRTFSFMSDKSRESKNSAKAASYRESLKETPAEKRRSHFTTKANPTIAINEAQPVALALEAPTLASLRSIQHTDSFGNPIAEPDLSNPTRPRWERPLDTIRSFEAAIDTEYKRRSLMRTETAPADYHGYNSRRSSYYGDHNPRHSQAGGYYGTRTPAARESYPDNSYGAPPVPAHGRARPGPRMYSENGMNRYSTSYNNQSTVYPTQAYQQSRDTVNTGGSSGSEPWANNTDPSSDNSSLERVTPLTKPETGEQYGFTGFGGAPILEEYGSSSVTKKPLPTPGSQQNNNQPGGYFQQQHHAGAPPSVPPKYSGNSRPGPNQRGSSKLIRLSQAQQQMQPLAATSGNVPPARKALPAANAEKRKSWFMRRFSSKD